MADRVIDFNVFRTCRACERELPIESFPTDKRKKYCKSYRCKDCKRSYTQSYWRIESVKQRESLRRKTDPKYIDARKNRQRIYRSPRNVAPEVKERRNKQKRENRANSPMLRVHESMSARMRHDLKSGKCGNSLNDVMIHVLGYDFVKLKNHLEKKFKEGMSWDNYGSVWHIDHVIPATVFNFQSIYDYDFQRCWSLKNIQPLWSEDNLKKGSKIERPFQPSLAMRGIGGAG